MSCGRLCVGAAKAIVYGVLSVVTPVSSGKLVVIVLTFRIVVGGWGCGWLIISWLAGIGLNFWFHFEFRQFVDRGFGAWGWQVLIRVGCVPVCAILAPLLVIGESANHCLPDVLLEILPAFSCAWSSC